MTQFFLQKPTKYICNQDCRGCLPSSLSWPEPSSPSPSPLPLPVQIEDDLLNGEFAKALPVGGLATHKLLVSGDAVFLG